MTHERSELDLFDQGVRPLARRTDPATSHLAAIMASHGSAASQRRRILCVLLRGTMNHADVDRVLEWDAHTAGRRLPELRRLCLVERTGTQSKTPRGRLAEDYALTAEGRQLASALAG